MLEEYFEARHLLPIIQAAFALRLGRLVVPSSAMQFFKRYGLLPLISVGLTWFLYGGALRLPFYSDDLLQIPFMQATPWFQFWYTAGPYGDYRPLHFSLWRLFFWIVGPANPAAFHGLNLIGHALCGVLVGIFAARRETASPWFALICTALFVSFPFAFDSVLWVSSFSYPLVTALAVGAVAFYLHARTQNAPYFYIAAFALTLLAGFSFEGGIVTGAAILLAELTLAPRPFSRWAIGGLLASIVPFALIVVFTTSTSGKLSLLPPIENILAAIQAIAFPVALLATRAQSIDVSPLLALSLLGLLTLFAVGYLLYRAKSFNWFLFGLGWFILWSAIPILTQDYNWMRDPLRVFYPSAVGVALIWGLVVDTPRKWWPLQAALAVIVILPAAIFVYTRTAIYVLASRPLAQVIEFSVRDNEPLLFVNLPGRITPAERWYPLGHEGAILMPPPNQISDVVLVNSGYTRNVFERSAGNILPSLDFAIEPAGESVSTDNLRSINQIVITHYEPDRISLEVVGSVEETATSQPSTTRFGESMALIEATCHPLGPDTLQLNFQWQLINPISTQPTTFVHILNTSGEIVAQADGDPLHGLYPFALWQLNELVQDTRLVSVITNEVTSVNVGLWEPASGTRWEAFDQSGAPLPDSVFHFDCR